MLPCNKLGFSTLACCATQLKDKTKVTAFQPGQALSVAEMFKEGDFVDVAGMSIGKGFQGKVMGGHWEDQHVSWVVG